MQKRKKEAQEVELLEKAILCMEKEGKEESCVKDVDDIFGQFVACELRAIQDDSEKRLKKFKIHSIFYGAENTNLHSHTMQGSWFPSPFPYPVSAGSLRFTPTSPSLSNISIDNTSSGSIEDQ